MFSLKPCKTHYYNTGFLANLHNLTKLTKIPSSHFAASKMLGPHKRKAVCVRASSSGQGEAETKSSDRRPFLTLEEAGLVEISGLSTHERFLCRLTISSLNLLRVISEQEGCPIEELNAGKVCDWFVKDKLKREQKLDTAVLQWDDSELF